MRTLKSGFAAGGLDCCAPTGSAIESNMSNPRSDPRPIHPSLLARSGPPDLHGEKDGEGEAGPHRIDHDVTDGTGPCPRRRLVQLVDHRPQRADLERPPRATVRVQSPALREGAEPQPGQD